jgi:hypothetical protein
VTTRPNTTGDVLATRAEIGECPDAPESRVIHLVRSALAAAGSPEVTATVRRIHLGLARAQFDRLVRIGQELRVALEAREREEERLATIEKAQLALDGVPR